MERVHSTEGAVALAGRILMPRSRPLVVVSTAPGTDGSPLDLDELSDSVGDVADLVLIATGEATYALDEHLPDRTQVYGGAGRSYPADFGVNPEWSRSPLRFPGKRATAQLVSDVLAHANAAGLFERRPSAQRVAASGVVTGFVAGGDRAIVELEHQRLATVSRELTYPPIPLDWSLRVGQRVTGTLELESRRMLVEQPAPGDADLRAAFPHGCVTLALVRKVTQARGTLLLHPSREFVLRLRDVSPNPHDTVDLLIAEGDVVRVRVSHLSDGTVHLGMTDVDDDEPVLAALALTAGGDPWLVEGRDLRETTEAAADDLDDFDAQDQELVFDEADAATGDSTVAPSDLAEVEGAPAAEPAAPVPVAGPIPGPGRRVALPVAARVASEPQSQPQAPTSDRVDVKPGAALQTTQLQLAAEKARNAELKSRLAAAGADESAVSQLKAALAAAHARVREELAERGELQKRLKDLEARRSAGTRALREARRDASKPAVVETLEDRRARWATDEEWVRHEVYLAWVDRVAASDRSSWPLRDYAVGPAFADSLLRLDAGQFAKALRATVDAVIRRIHEIPARELHALRSGDGADDPDHVRATDGARCMRAYIEQNTPAARRLHFWQLPGGGVELSRVVTHDDVEP